MAALLTDAIPAAEFVVRHLYRPIDVATGSRYFAVAETENPRDDNWFWSDDNAKVLEFMSRPEVWRRFPRETREILRFVRSMCDGPLIFRRVSTPRLDPLGTEGGITRYCHSLMRLGYDLAQGAVVAGVRFHDERSADNLVLHGNYVEFTYRGRRFRRPVGTEPGNMQAEGKAHRLQLRQASEVHFDAGWQRRRLGEITYLYTFDATTMLFVVEVALDLAAGLAVSDVVLTIGHCGLARCLFNNIAADTSADATPLFAAGKPAVRLLGAGGARYYAIRQGHISADALALHSVPQGPQRLAGFEAAVKIQGRLDSVVARYEFPGTHRGGRLVAAENKLITAGGFYDRIADYTAIMRAASAASGARQAACDYSVSYDYGATLNALAKCFAVASAGAAPLDPPVVPAELRPLFDATLEHYFGLYADRHERQPNAIYSRELAFAMLGVATMYRATGDALYRRRLERLCDVLLDFEVRFTDGNARPASAFLMRKDNPDTAYLDCHSAALLALTQAARFAADRPLALVIERGLGSYCLAAPGRDAGMGGEDDTVALVAPADRAAGPGGTAAWNFKAGLTLRFFAALRNSPNPALRALAARHGDRIASFDDILRRQLLRSATERDESIEIRTSRVSAGTNSETQPWAMLGLLGHPFD